ncbi:hypothetical protein [Feifania hominis]|uniref:Stage III sporulation protein AG n=1 Tax=Feifania hominis TaxID=2763660 RepID=A0A926DCY8_9FIRM|nr:hypothetical protein [Feifania hominis]MBC8535541.1 hypothetical protein [Feifania hominis]
MEDWKDRLTRLFKGKRLTLFLILGLIGIALILLSEFWPASKPKQSDQSTVTAADMERDLLKLISNVEGVGKAEVMITLATGVENVYATEQRVNQNVLSDSTNGVLGRTENKNDTQDTVIVVRDSSGAEAPILIKQIEPKVQGVAVICEGADSPYVKSSIVEMVTTIYDISSNRVCVIKKNS